MLQENFFNYGGKIFKNNEPVILPANRSFRYGDGFFETMKMLGGKIILEALHLQRLFDSLERLQFQTPAYFTAKFLLQQVKMLAEKNNHTVACMVRINIFRGEGGLYDTENNLPNFIIETRALPNENNIFWDKDSAVDIYPAARKSCDEFSNIKSNNYLPYIMAARWAKKQPAGCTCFKCL